MNALPHRVQGLDRHAYKFFIMGGPIFDLIDAIAKGDFERAAATIGAMAVLLFICFPVHEYAHAWAANKLGDDTAEKLGRLSINPFVHLDLVGSL